MALPSHASAFERADRLTWSLKIAVRRCPPKPTPARDPVMRWSARPPVVLVGLQVGPAEVSWSKYMF